MSKCGVILCECNGALERRISLQELSCFIHNISPDLEIVTGNNLCKPRELSLLLEKSKVYPSVIAACNELNSQAPFWQEPDDTKINPCFTKYVNILSEIDSSFSDVDVSDRVKLLLGSQITKASCCDDISQDNMRLHFSLPQNKTSRRNLASALLPKYEVIPSILNNDCLGCTCGICAGICPVGAIEESDNTLKIDKSICTRCGACVNVCPIKAISYPGYSIIELEREIEGLLSNEVGLSNRILNIICQQCLNPEETISPNILPVKVPSLAIVSPLLLLNAFNLGADGIALIHNEDKCSSKMSIESLKSTTQLVQQLLDRWGIDKNRITYINTVNANSSPMNSVLRKFVDEIMAIGHTPFKSAAGSMTFEGMYSLTAIIKEMDSKIQVSTEGTIAGECVPFGYADIDQTRCSGCSICAHSCPTGAISYHLSNDSSNLKLKFQHNKCIACEICVSRCPEECININKVLDFSRLSDLKETIFEGKFVICHNCSKPYATKAMIDVLKQKLEKAGIFSTEWTEYCPSCRMAIQQKR